MTRNRRTRRLPIGPAVNQLLVAENAVREHVDIRTEELECGTDLELEIWRDTDEIAHVLLVALGYRHPRPLDNGRRGMSFGQLVAFAELVS